LAITVAILTAHYQYEIYQCPYTATTKSQQLHNAHSGFTRIETMNAQRTQKETEQQRNQPLIIGSAQRSLTSVRVTTIRTRNSLIRYLMATLFAINQRHNSQVLENSPAVHSGNC
jgi:hypothetical protein